MNAAILFVCAGNICRSPTAHAVLQQKLVERGAAARVAVDSAGIGDWHAGELPDRRSREHAARRGYDLSGLRARQVTRADFSRFSHVLAMDRQNLQALQRLRPDVCAGELGLFLSYGRRGLLEVPDPYYGGAEGFEQVLDLVEDAAEGLLARLGLPA